MALAAALVMSACGDDDDDGGDPSDAASPDAPAAERRLLLLYTSDEHSHLFGWGPEIDDYPEPAAPGGDTDIVGSIARRATVLDELRAAAVAEQIDTLTMSADRAVARDRRGRARADHRSATARSTARSGTRWCARTHDLLRSALPLNAGARTPGACRDAREARPAGVATFTRVDAIATARASRPPHASRDQVVRGESRAPGSRARAAASDARAQWATVAAEVRIDSTRRGDRDSI
jgi:hypothetical protein